MSSLMCHTVFVNCESASESVDIILIHEKHHQWFVSVSIIINIKWIFWAFDELIFPPNLLVYYWKIFQIMYLWNKQFETLGDVHNMSELNVYFTDKHAKT